MNKEELEAKVNELELTLNSLDLNAKVVQEDLNETVRSLEAINKPKITKEFVEEINRAIEDVFDRSSFNEVDSYDVDFEIDYNNSLVLGSIEFNDADSVAEALLDAIEGLFNVIEE